jgi:hypothetical protein
MDIFRERLSLGIYPTIPDYKGPLHDVDAWQAFFAEKFKRLVRDTSREMYIHYIEDTGIGIFESITSSLEESILSRFLFR